VIYPSKDGHPSGRSNCVDQDRRVTAKPNRQPKVNENRLIVLWAKNNFGSVEVIVHKLADFKVPIFFDVKYLENSARCSYLQWQT